MSRTADGAQRTRLVRALLALLLVMTLLPAARAKADESPLPAALDLVEVCYGVPGAGFPDITRSPHQYAIDCLKAYGLTQGRSDGTYGPSAHVRRWQMAVFIARLADHVDDRVDDFAVPTDPPQPFTDVDGLSAEARDAVAVLAALEIVEGVGNDHFDPFGWVKRSQMASFINRLQRAINRQVADVDAGFVTDDDFFTDDDGNVAHEANINAIASVGIATGREHRYFPQWLVRRDQMASFLVRHVAVNIDDGLLATAFPTPADAPAQASIATDFAAAIDTGDVDRARQLSTPRAFQVVADETTDDPTITDVTYEDRQAQRGPIVEFAIGQLRFRDADTLFNCSVAIGLVRSCDGG